MGGSNRYTTGKTHSSTLKIQKRGRNFQCVLPASIHNNQPKYSIRCEPTHNTTSVPINGVLELTSPTINTRRGTVRFHQMRARPLIMRVWIARDNFEWFARAKINPRLRAEKTHSTRQYRASLDPSNTPLESETPLTKIWAHMGIVVDGAQCLGHWVGSIVLEARAIILSDSRAPK